MQDDLIQYDNATSLIVATWQPVSAEAAIPYLKAIALVMILLASWAGLCAI
jgi:hypothetical protein